MRKVGVATLIATALVLGGCGGEDSSPGSSAGQAGQAEGGGQTTTVVAEDFSFATSKLAFRPGAEVTVTLDNQGEAEHTFSISELDVEAEAAGGETAEATFTMPKSGSFEFFCKYHPDDMRGTLDVIGAAGGASDEKEDDGGASDEKEDDGGASDEKEDDEGDVDPGSGAGGY